MTDPNNGCTDPAFPIFHPAINLNLHFPQIPWQDLKYIRLSSDPPKSSGRPAGYTLHADWVNGWDQRPRSEFGGISITDMLLRECYMVNYTPRPQHSDCHDFNLGQGGGSNWFFQDSTPP